MLSRPVPEYNEFQIKNLFEVPSYVTTNKLNTTMDSNFAQCSVGPGYATPSFNPEITVASRPTISIVDVGTEQAALMINTLNHDRNQLEVKYERFKIADLDAAYKTVKEQQAKAITQHAAKEQEYKKYLQQQLDEINARENASKAEASEA